MPLTDAAIRAAKPAEKAQKLFDGKGLYLLITPNGTKGWRLKYHFLGKEKLISLGSYPSTSLKEAREKAADARKTLENGIDPSAQRKQDKQLAQNTFELVAMEWIERQKTKWSPNYADTTYRRLKRNIFPFIGSRPVNAITAPELLTLLRKVEARGIIGTAHALKNHCSCIMRYAIATSRAEWQEFDFEDKLWRIPAERMKMRRDHLVPLSKQTLTVLEKLRAYSGGNQYVFPSYRSETIPFGKTALSRAIRRMGFEEDEMCPHGFRAMASTLLNELGYNRDWIERQLAHAPTEQIRGIYNRAEYLPERRRMLQEWADYLDGLRAKARQEAELE